MKNILTLGAALMLTTTAATAGGIDRSGQSIGAIFQDGKYVELSYGSVTPSVSGSVLGGALQSGNVAPSYGTVGLAFKTDVNDKVSLALIVDQPFGADVNYATAGYILTGTAAQVKTTSITAVGRYKFNDNVSVHFGPRFLTASGNYTAVVGGRQLYTSTYDSGSATGYVVGAAYERKDIAMRVALTFSSSIDLALNGDGAGGFGNLTATMPATLNLDFQSGVAADTLVFGSVRWAEWSKGHITDAVAGELVSWTQDVMTYTLGVGRKFSDSFSGALSVGYEKAQGDVSSNLSPTDGYTSVSLGGTYKLGSGVELTGGVRYIMAGNTTTNVPISSTAVTPSDFSNNSAVAVGLKIAYTF